MALGRGVNVHHADEDSECHKMLNNEELVTPTSDWCHGAEHDPDKESPCDNTSVRERIRTDLLCNKRPVGPPVTQPVAEMDGRGNEKTASTPSMQPVDSLIAHAGQKANDVVLAGQ